MVTNKDVTSFLAKGAELYYEQKYQLALHQYEEAIKLDSNCADAYQGGARASAMLTDWQKNRLYSAAFNRLKRI